MIDNFLLRNPMFFEVGAYPTKLNPKIGWYVVFPETNQPQMRKFSTQSDRWKIQCSFTSNQTTSMHTINATRQQADYSYLSKLQADGSNNFISAQ